MKTRQSEELENRFIDFGVAIIKMTQSHKSILPFSVIDQVIRAATSIGVNYAEAQNASSRADFKNKIFIAKKEAAETRYWLKIVEQLVDSEAVESNLAEVQEVILILQKITNTLREKSAT